MLGVEAKGSPVKGKVKDDGRWRANWWDFHPLVDNIHRPVVWSSSSTIFTAHPSQPLLLGRLFPSSKQFVVVSPDPVLRAPSSYEPPSVISVSPNDRWLFAFFPAREGDSIACLWRRGPQVDNWIVWECWPFSRGAGVVTAAWAGVDREWVASSDGSCSRLPLRGPFTPVSNPTLLLITQSHELHVCYLRAYLPSLRVLSCSLSQPYLIAEKNQTRTAIHDVPSGPRASRLCVKATIGFMYSESSLLVAMRSRRYPSSESLKPAAYHDIDLDLPLDLPQHSIPQEQLPHLDWGALAEELTIELCEVKLRFDGTAISIISHPLPPLHHPSPHLTNLAFICTPPPKLDPNTSPRASPKKDKQPGRLMSEPAATFLVASFLDCDDHSSVPKSEMIAYSISRVGPSPVTKTPWSIRQVGERSFSPRVLLSFVPGWSPINQRQSTIVVMLADMAGSIPRGGLRETEVSVGCFVVLQLPDLSDDPEWDRLSMMSPPSRAGMDWPVSVAVSTNHALLCAMSMTRTSIHLLPKLHARNMELGATRLLPFSITLASALASHKSIVDIAHVLSMPTTPMEGIVDTLSGVLLSYDINARAGSVSSFTLMDAVGAEVEIYKARARQSTDDDEKEFLTSLWENALDICSVASTITAFEDCKGNGGYDLDAVWQLVSLSEWAIYFLEILMKECLTLSDLTDVPSKDIQLKAEPVDDDPFLRENLFRVDVTSPFDKPVLLHLVHPLLLANLIDMTSHVNEFYQSLNSLTAKGENGQIARDALLDVVDCSGLNLEGLESMFRTLLGEVNGISGEDARFSLAKCHPVSAQREHLKGFVQTLFTSAAINKPRLFIKPSDLLDGFISLSISEQPLKEQGRDVVTKRLLKRGGWLTCLRCGHHSEVGGDVGGDISLAWRSWERMWMTECICGGTWASENM
ncbi:hypothetical protein V8B97DRAFT_2021711 [Scleroderma yunnanense]